jgi:hypothetical protein
MRRQGARDTAATEATAGGELRPGGESAMWIAAAGMATRAKMRLNIRTLLEL